jgi:hypothetical protein
MDEATAGLLDGLDNQIDGRFAAKGADGIEFGYPVFGYEGDPEDAYQFFQDVDKIVFDADFVTGNTINGVVNGVAYAEVTFDTDHDTTVAALVSAIAALSGVEAVLDSEDTDSRTIIVRTKGATCVATSVVTNGASQAVATITSDTGQIFLGMAVKTQNSSGLYEQYDAVNVLVGGRVWGQCSTAAQANLGAYVGTDGKLANTGDSLGITFRSNLSAAGLVIVEMRGKQALGLSAKFAA